MQPANALEKLRHATQELAEVRDARDAKSLMDKASAAKHYAMKAQLGQDAIDYAHAIKIDAERLLGGFLKAGPKNAGAAVEGIGKRGSTVEPRCDAPPTLADLGLTKKVSSASQKLHAIAEKFPESFSAIRAGKKTLPQATKELAKAQKADATQTAQKSISTAARKSISSVCDIRACSMRDLLTSGIRPNCIITDPPYPHEYLPLYGALAELSKDIPLVAVMCGQSYLPEVLKSMCAHLKYRWTLAYLTPGGQAVQLWKRKVNTFWKPVLLFGEIPDRWLGDVSKSDVNDNDKRFHDWGQSESGMADLVERLSEPGQLVCDPFVGGGATAVAALRLGRRFVGSDIDADAVKTSIGRCEAVYA